jgi:hypothetical protein
MFNRTTSTRFIAPRRQGAKLRIFSEFSELGVFAPLRETGFPDLFFIRKSQIF